jgi:hypothetical protein
MFFKYLCLYKAVKTFVSTWYPSLAIHRHVLNFLFDISVTYLRELLFLLVEPVISSAGNRYLKWHGKPAVVAFWFLTLKIQATTRNRLLISGTTCCDYTRLEKINLQSSVRAARQASYWFLIDHISVQNGTYATTGDSWLLQQTEYEMKLKPRIKAYL